ncbi:MAG: DUF1073 domain-containing protein [Desulfobacteraceae bacterium]|nr:DUF1073 domain-containing protein [Desulfobacteraceae bacterium]
MPKNSMTPTEAKTLRNAAKIIKERTSKKKGRILVSGLESFVTDLGYSANTPQINKTDTLALNVRRQPLTFDRPTLNYIYQEHGIIRTAIDQPVDDALRGGVIIKSDELNPDDIKKMDEFMEKEGTYETIKTTMKWCELFGGAGIIINNGQDPSTRLDLSSMTEDSPLAMYDADRWELGMPNRDNKPDQSQASIMSHYFYYTQRIHRSRVLALKGDTAPSLTRRMLMGWGLSKCEKMVRDLNKYIKANDVIFELLDEAKIDIYKFEGYKAALLKPEGQAKMAQAVGLTNSTKNYLNALILDKEDDYMQKQLTFSGLAEMLKEIRIGIAATLRMPMDKLFGLSASGFNSGDADIENYNSMIESDIRARLRPVIRSVLEVIFVKLFGFIPSFTFDFQSLRIMSQMDEEAVKTSKANRILVNYERGLTTAKETMEAQRAENLLPIEKTATERGLTDDFPVPPIEKVTQTIKAEETNESNP